MSQHLQDDVLFKSPLGKPVTELRRVGTDFALYTEDNTIFQRFKAWEQLLFFNRYTFQDTRGKEHFIGVDLYFPKSAKKQLIQALSNKQPPTPKKGGQTDRGIFTKSKFRGIKTLLNNIPTKRRLSGAKNS